jgi:hypothetical protein
MKRVFTFLILVLVCSPVLGQVELVPVEHRVYDFLRRMDAKGVIDFNSAVLPVSRREVAEQLRVMSDMDSSLKHTGMTGKMSRNDVMMLKDFCKEFEFELGTKVKDVHELRKLDELNELKERIASDLENNNNLGFEDKKGKSFTTEHTENPQRSTNNNESMGSRLKRAGMTGRNFIEGNKYIYKYVDTNVAVWGHLTGGMYFLNGTGDSLGAKKFLAGDLGFEVRGTMFDRLGFAMNYSNGKVFVGNAEDKKFANTYDPFFRTAVSLKDDGKFFDHFTGYIRYEVPMRWLSLMVGKESVRQGFGFVDNLFFSGMLPYSMIKLDMKYKAVGYTFSYGNIKGDSMGVDVPNKMISTHRVDVKFAKWLRTGFYESVITSNTAFSFVHFNPLSFITSADLNTGGIETFKSNSLLGFDVEMKPFRNVVVQGTLLVDDFNFASISKDDYTSNDNKFGYQAGVMWNDAFTLDGFSGAMEYTRLDPFVYTHRDNKQQFTDWGYSLGHQLPPNSDEIALKFGYNVMPRLSVNVLMQFQRSGEGFTYDSLGNIDINYGGNINHGENFSGKSKNKFLQGNRVNRSVVTLGVKWEPVRQWVMDLGYRYRFEDLIYASKKGKDHFFYLKLGVKI